MRSRLRTLRDDERGMSFVFVGVGFLAFFAATTLAVDVGMIMTARSQAQNAADAAALAGAVALVKDSYTDRSATGPVVTSAINTAMANDIIGHSPSVWPVDVSFPSDADGRPNRVRVRVYRSMDRSNAVPTLIGPLFGVTTVDIGAVATAEAAPANAMTCVKPFMIPDKWTENSDGRGNPTGEWTADSTFDVFFNNGNPLPNPDVYIDATHEETYTGYTVEHDVGTELILRAGTGDQINPSFYYSWKMPGDIGGDFYRENIANCNQELIVWGTTIVQEPGDKTGPTIQGIEDLIAKDPNASWDTTCRCVVNSSYSTSPRLFPIPLYDPWVYANGKQNGRPADFQIANFIGFFVDHVSGNRIYGRITNVVGVVSPNAGPAPAAAFPKAIRLVE